MKSAILTKVNTFTPRFPEQIELRKEAPGDNINFLKEVVRIAHGAKAEIFATEESNKILVCTSQGYYYYSIFQTYILRINLGTQEKKYYRIS